MSDHGQIEVQNNGYTDTLYEFCGHEFCREMILTRGFEIEGDVLTVDEFDLSDDENRVIVTVRHSLDESDSCVWCIGCGDFLRHGLSCDCADRGYDPDEDRESMRPLVQEEPLGQLRLIPWDPHSGMLPDPK